MSVQNKSREHRLVKLWCDKCKAEVIVKTRHAHEAKFCPMCRTETVIEVIQYE